MKITAILLLILGCLLIVGLGLLSFFLFAMSFDAPGSEKDPKAWMFRYLLFLPILGLIIAFVLAIIAFASGNYVRSVRLGLVFVVAIIGILAILFKSQLDNDRYHEEKRKQELEDAKHPVQEFIRPTEDGVDTIIVFPSRVVAYRLFDKTFNRTIGGPIGKLNNTRDTIQLEERPDSSLRRKEYEEFVNSEGKKFTDCFQFKK